MTQAYQFMRRNSGERYRPTYSETYGPEDTLGLFVVPVELGYRTGPRSPENFREVSTIFFADPADILNGTLDTAVAATWSANSTATDATLLAAIDSALTTAGYTLLS